jgi:hypothetical protein
MLDGKTWLHADYALQCNGGGDDGLAYNATHALHVTLAWIMVGVYPIGIPMYFAYSLALRAPRRAAHDDTSVFAAWRSYVWAPVHRVVSFWRRWVPATPQVDEEAHLDMLFVEKDAEWVPNPKEVAVRGFLFEAYDPHFYYFEVVDLIRKVFFTGIIVFIAPGTPSQLVISLMVSFFVIVLYAYTKPFALDSDDTAMLLSNIHIFAFLFYGLLKKLQPTDQDVVFGYVLVMLFWVQVVLAVVLLLYSQLEPLWAKFAEFRRKHPGARVSFFSFYLGGKKTTERLLAEAGRIPNLADIVEAQSILDERVVQERIESRDVAQMEILVKLQYTLSRELQRLQKGRKDDAAFADASNRLLKNVVRGVVSMMNSSSVHGKKEIRELTELQGHVATLWDTWKRGAGTKVGDAAKEAKARRGSALGIFFQQFSGNLARVRRSIVGSLKVGPDASVLAWKEEYRRTSGLLDDVLKNLNDLAHSMASTRSVNDRLAETFALVLEQSAVLVPRAANVPADGGGPVVLDKAWGAEEDVTEAEATVGPSVRDHPQPSIEAPESEVRAALTVPSAVGQALDVPTSHNLAKASLNVVGAGSRLESTRPCPRGSVPCLQPPLSLVADATTIPRPAGPPPDSK